MDCGQRDPEYSVVLRFLLQYTQRNPIGIGKYILHLFRRRYSNYTEEQSGVVLPITMMSLSLSIWETVFFVTRRPFLADTFLPAFFNYSRVRSEKTGHR